MDINPRLPEPGCAAEPIHVPGTIQPHGVLLAAEPGTWRIVAASTQAGFGEDMLGRRLGSVLGEGFAVGVAERSDRGELLPSAPWETALELPQGLFDVAVHAHAGLVVVELERGLAGDDTREVMAARRLRRALALLRDSEARMEALATVVVQSVRALTGYERVLIYRFDEDWNGQAVAEDMIENFPQPLLGLLFPESDIPAQARALYHTATVRSTQSRDAVPCPLVVASGHARIDLSHARLRSLSPIHLDYHRNLGVDGAMSLSILDGKRLWGLVVCHHRQPHRISPAQRAAALAVTDAFALRVRPAELAGSETARWAEVGRAEALMAQMATVEELEPALTRGSMTMLDLFGARGAAVVQGDAVSALGVVPPAADLRRLAKWLRTAGEGEVFSTASLPSRVPDWPHATAASGLLAVFLDPARADMLLWFRPEEPHQVTWGGNPNKPQDGPLLPRKSFARWVEDRRGVARPWAAHEFEIAGQLRHAITEVILRSLRRLAAVSEQLRQSQKMEAVGQLTGGLAHDFNNLLGGIRSSLELAQMRVAQGRTGELDRYLTAALGSASRAAALTHRLLSFSRRQTLSPKAVDANALIRSMGELVRGTAGPGIQVDVVGSVGLWPILCDENQLENAILNLALNARDAMPQGGRLTIEAANVRMDDAVAAELEMPPGHYVAVSVTDTGHGMTPEVVSRVFEPFFTTKPLGRGTGLGLSMVYGFAKQSGGQARVYSEVQQGTTVRLLMPRHDGAASSGEAAPAAPRASTHLARIVVVDDEPLLRSMVVEALAEAGYVVKEGGDGPQGLAALEALGSVDLLLSDVGLPGAMNGRQLVEAARARWPGLKVLFMTGYAENAALSGGVLDPVTQVVTKPFGLPVLMDKVRAMVGGAA